MKTADSYLVLRVSWLREHDQVIAELVELWLDRQAKQQPEPKPIRIRAQHNANIRIRSHHAHA
ncbi:TPA: hypothetical protein ACPHWC_006369 [Pseudomonas aeruginosa]|jgi:hypothetical protein|uniref:Uncharacterized protein n=2 Tax=Burkholderiales TaxID=80840 RepID=A0A939KBA0_9BURK|nr:MULTISPECIES: hypothetical protein [Pseudomonadota]HAY5544813.1 hypothetical protein [Escherichia coli]AVE35602.1 hypothetical protein HV91_26795 [Pseudomonas aeruginosa]EIU5460405.1 hypothetical protein [Pseudomonas aeruginosa]EIU5543816.1 hypothetical protein [Pseudomonas aeruginosa]EKW4494379.1 hypothetical protein [Pseudomonas aeruginosa]